MYQSLQSDELSIDWVKSINKFAGKADLTIILDIEPELVKIENKLRSEIKDTSTKEQLQDVEPQEIEEAPLFAESENDEDLLTIFKEESSIFISIIDKAIDEFLQKSFYRLDAV